MKVANVSWGKDSTAMLLRMLEGGVSPDRVAFFDTGMEFNAVYRVRDMVLPLLRERGIEYTELHPLRPMWFDMLCKPVTERGGGMHYGYGWCGGPCRWGTSNKVHALDRDARDAETIFVGIAADEVHRCKSEARKSYPLVEWGMTEADCLDYCRSRGIDWLEGDVRLYDVLDRVSCWCCRNKNLKELRAIRVELPGYWELLNGLETQLGPMKGEALGDVASGPYQPTIAEAR